MRNHLTSLFLSLTYGSSSATDPIRLSLEATSAKWFRGVWISGIVVAIGCGLEIWEVAFDLKNWWRHRRKRDLILDNPGSWRYPMAALGITLVVGGIVGETVFEVLDANIESQLRSHASDLISDAEQKTTIADNRAGDAETRAGKLDKEAAQLTKDAESERLERVKLQLELAKLKAPRELSAAQQRDLVRELKPFSGTPITIDSGFSRDGEANALTVQLWVVLNRAGWKVAYGPPPPVGVSSDAASTLGIVVVEYGELMRGGVPIPHRFATASEALSKGLKNIGFLSKYPGEKIVSDNPNESVRMIVGRKP
jgi:hypothetical protein